MRIMACFVPLAALVLSACAATTPPPRLSAADPADPKAPESVVQPTSSLLESPTAQRSGAAPGDVYSCPMHPQVREAKAGKCPMCGMTLTKQAPKPREGQQP